MPYRTSSPASRADAEAVVAALGCASPSWSTSRRWSTATSVRRAGRRTTADAALRRGNFAARMRMAVLYDRSVTWGGLVVGTGNKTESLIGYTTLFGDIGLRVQPDRRPVQEPGPPAGGRDRRARRDHRARRRRPTCGPARPTRARAGFSYPVLDRLLFWRIDKRRSIEEMVGARLRARRWSSGSTGWSPAPSSSARSRRSPSSGRGRPASTTSTRAGGRGRRAGDRRGPSEPRRARRRRAARAAGRAVRRRHADREPGRRDAARARGPARRAAHRRRGHAAHAPAARPPRDRRRG